MNKENTQIVVIGSGAAGLGAAIGASEKGADVIVLEKAKTVGGISVTGMGIFAVESHLQKEKNVNFSRDDAFKLIMEMTQWKADAKLVRAYVDKSADTVKWLENMGVKFALLDKLTYPGAVNQTGHLVLHPTIGVGANATSFMIQKMNDRAKELGVDVRMNCQVIDIDHESETYRVLYKDGDGGECEITAKAVVIAAGGYVHDAELLTETGAHTGNNYIYNKSVGMANKFPLTGECIRMAWKLGAVPDGLGLMLTTYMDGEPFPRTPETQPLWDLLMFCFPYLWVNKNGERFVNEGNMNGSYMANAVARQKDGTYFMVFDKATVDKIKEEGPDVWGYLTDDVNIDIDALFDLVIEKGADNYYKADSIEELAEKMQVPADKLKVTIEEYNASCHDKHDALFAKDVKYLRPVETPTFYAMRRMNAGYGSVGGIKINHRAEAINQDFEVIQGLYGAGDCANGTVSYNTALMYTVWGGTLGFAVNSGRIAGESAADYVK